VAPHQATAVVKHADEHQQYPPPSSDTAVIPLSGHNLGGKVSLDTVLRINGGGSHTRGVHPCQCDPHTSGSSGTVDENSSDTAC
jgi:hypothetical protein